ncbi:DUF3800 domain-containing protein [Rhizobium phaseoli]|uniref:DUF3800 domain-containing protein n=1 Tax=Rhizobium phaseoli TaxID=396 RepID=UPI0007EB78C4|nr:DUF3800 domain-containing protein [Rhizobium phaseoli]ANL39520.1 hypothetical protein AMC88_CH01091 [Rhizobium phaseoli]ANL58509.1 hypothetical protein AMC85_CH01091 [Rhizobium phaseoli]
MAKSVNLYIDDSGSRKPDRSPNEQPPKFDYFAMGGFMIDEEEEDSSKIKYDAFCQRWEITYPLHSVAIRHAADNFSWLYKLPKEKKTQFYTDLHDTICSLPILGMGCVIDRGGYNTRYKEAYKNERWKMCKTAFNIVVERAARYANSRERKLRVFIESSGKKVDQQIRAYYKDLKSTGMPFDKDSSSKYAPLSQTDFSSILIDFQYKTKASKMMQLADLLLYPMAAGRYDPTYKAYELLVRDKKFYDAYLAADQLAQCGIKYSCFDSSNEKNSTEGLLGEKDSL